MLLERLIFFEVFNSQASQETAEQLFILATILINMIDFEINDFSF
jgi:hypothetical protein